MQSDVAVIGAGVIGASIALELARAGHDVIVVDKARGVGHGSTSASSAVVRFNYFNREGVAASWEAGARWAAWADHLGHTDPAGTARLVRSGMVMLDVDLAPRSAYLPHFDDVGVPYEQWDAATLAARIPAVDPGRHWPPKRIDDERFWADSDETLGGVFTPDAGFVSDPQLAAQNLATAATASGARFLLGREVAGVDVAGDRVRGLRLADGATISCPIVVNAAGPWSGAVNRLAGVGDDFTVGTRPMRQEVAHVRAPDGFHPDGGFGIGIADMDLGTYMRGETGGGLLIGGTEPECDPLQWLDDPDQAHPHATAAVFEPQVTRAARRLPGLTVPNRPRGVVGVYDVADDWTPIYDRTALGGFYVAIGTSGNQFKNAPVVGSFLTSIIEATENGADHDEKPVVWAGDRTGVTVDLGAFSRRRTHAASSGTVLG